MSADTTPTPDQIQSQATITNHQESSSSLNTLHTHPKKHKRPSKKAWLAMLLSLLIPGTGQFYLHNTLQGLIHFCMHHIALILWIFVHHFHDSFYYILILGINLAFSVFSALIEGILFSKGKVSPLSSYKRSSTEEHDDFDTAIDNVDEDKTLTLEKNESEQEDEHEVSRKDRVRFSLRFKLFIMVVLLIFGLLYVIFLLITQEIESSLTDQLKRKGDAISYQTAASANIMMTDLQIEAEINNRTLDISEYKLKLVDLISKKDHPRDVIYSFIINEEKVTIIHSEDIMTPNESQKKEFKPYIFPQNVFPSKALHEMKFALGKYLALLVRERIRNGISPMEVGKEIQADSFFESHAIQLEKQSLRMHELLFLDRLEEWERQKKEAVIQQKKQREAEIEAMRELGFDEETILMTMPPDAPPDPEPAPIYQKPKQPAILVYHAFNILQETWVEYEAYLNNTRNDLFMIIVTYEDLFADLLYINQQFPEGINIASWVWDQFLQISDVPALYEENVLLFSNKIEAMFAAIDEELESTHTSALPEGFRTPYEEFKNSITQLLLRVTKFINPGKAIIQSYTRKQGNRDEMILDISYPICSLNHFRRGLIRNYMGEVHIGVSLKNITFTIRDVQRTLQMIAIIVLIIGMVVSFVMATFLVAPIRRMVQAMRMIGEGNLDVKVETHAHDEIGLLANNFNEMAAGLQEKERIRSIMDKAVSKEIAEEMLRGEIKLGGETRIITIFFSDIRKFTTISESMSPENLIHMLNEYLSAMNAVIDKHRGVVDKFIGDAVMALFGAPLPLNDEYGNPYDAEAGVRAALEMQAALINFNAVRRERGEIEIHVGMGINTGPVVAGNMGSDQRMNYTVLGDGVNLASRLEGATKTYGVSIIISENTYESIINKDAFYIRELDLIKVVGKTQPVKIFEVMGFSEKD